MIPSTTPSVRCIILFLATSGELYPQAFSFPAAVFSDPVGAVFLTISSFARIYQLLTISRSTYEGILVDKTF
jgi:hypothetical protein